MASTAVKIALGVGCGILLAVGALMATCTGCMALVGKNMADAEVQKKQALANVTFEDVEGGDDGSFFKITGKVRNTGEDPVTYVKVGVELLDQSGRIVDTDWTFAVDGNALQPGAARSFDVMTRSDGSIERFRYFIMTD